jgi:hypothetical protein
VYGKFFSSTFTGSMMAAGSDVFAVWSYAISHAYKAHVELNPKLLAAVIGSTPEKMQTAIDFLCSDDPASRSKEHNGKRLVRDGEFQYFLPNHEKYRNIVNEDERRQYNRIKKQESRTKSNQ